MDNTFFTFRQHRQIGLILNVKPGDKNEEEDEDMGAREKEEEERGGGIGRSDSVQSDVKREKKD